MCAVRATFVVPYPRGRAPGQRFRFEQWLDLLPSDAIDAEVKPLLSARAYDSLYQPGHHVLKAADTIAGAARRVVDAASARRSDVVFIYREAFPFGPPVLERWLESRVPVVFDFDDAIWLGDTSAANAWVKGFKRPEKFGKIVADAALTLAGNEYLADHARTFTSRVQVVPTTLDVVRYAPVRVPRQPSQRITVGWSGSPSTAAHLKTIEGPLRRALRELPIDLHIVGAPGFSLPRADHVRVIPWSAATEINTVGSFDIGLMPLPDDEWAKGKCGFKALLYMALGVPAIASPVGVNPTIISSGDNGLLPRTDTEWFDAIALLVENEHDRRRIGAAGRDTVVERYSGQRWAPRFLDLLRQAADSR